MVTLKKTKLFLSIILCFLPSSVFAIEPAYIKGTYLPVRPDLKHLSPIMGCMFWEGGVIRKYYEMGYLTEKANKNDWLAQGDGLIRLVHALFNVVEGSFGVSTNLSYPAAHFSVKTVAKIIAALEKARTQKQQLTAESIKNIIENDEDFKQSVEATKAKYQATKDPRLDTQRLSGKSGRSPRVGYCRTLELSQAIVDAFNVPPNIYPEFSVYSILLAFMYRKAINKQEFLDYFNILNREIDSTVFTPTELPQNWLANNFQESDLVRIKNELQENVVNQNNLEILKDKLYEEAVYGQIISKFYKGSLPKVAQYKTVVFESLSFSDCMETTLRNLCNIILYDEQASTFDLSKVPEVNFDSRFSAFYQNPVNKQAVNVEALFAHQDWVIVVENQPWVAYYKMVENGIVQKAGDTNGFIIIPQEVKERLERDGNKVKMAGRWYIPIDGIQQKGFELQPSVRNIIILLNQFFGLNIFNNDIAKAFLQTDFNSTHLPILAERLGLDEIIVSDIDAHDYTERPVRITFSDFSIELSEGHGELEVSYVSQNIVDLTPLLVNHIMQNMNILENYLYIQLFSIYPLSCDQFSQIVAHKIPVFSFIFFLDLFDNNMRAAVFSEYLARQPRDERIDNLSAKIIQKLAQQPDTVYLERAFESFNLTDQIGQIILKEINFDPQDEGTLFKSISFTQFLISKGQVYPEALQLAQGAVKFPNINVKSSGLGLFKNLVEKGQAFKEAAQVAQQAVLSPDGYVQISGLDLFKALVEKEQEYKEATQAAQQAVLSPDEWNKTVRAFGLSLFNALFEKGQGYQEAAEAARSAVQSEDVDVRRAGIDLFKALFEKDQGFDQAAQAARSLVQSEDPNVQMTGFGFFGNLVEKGQGYVQAAEAAKSALQSTDEYEQKKGQELLSKLREKGFVE